MDTVAWLAYISIVLSGSMTLFIVVKVWPVARDALSLLRAMARECDPNSVAVRFRNCDRCRIPIYFDTARGYRDAVLLHEWFECSRQEAA